MYQEMLDEYNEQSDVVKRSMDYGMKELERQIAVLEKNVEAEEQIKREEAIAASPEGRMLYHLCWAMQYDYLGQEDYEGVIEYTRNKLAEEGIQLSVVKTDG